MPTAKPTNLLFINSRQSQHKTQCGIVDLFHEFVSNIVMKQLKIFFTTIAEMVGSIGSKLAFLSNSLFVSLNFNCNYFFTETYGILITVVTIYFMKDLLVTIIQSVFKYIINPTIWSRVAADVASSSSSEGNSERAQNIPLVGGHDLRDINVGKALDLANQHIQLILETRKNEISPIQPSGVEILAVTGTVSSVSTASATSSLSLSPSSSSTAPDFSQVAAKNHVNNATNMPTEEQQNNHMEDDDTSNESYEEIGDELVMSQNISVVSINDTQPSEMSSTTTTSTTTTTASTEYISSLKSSDTSSTSFTSDSTKPSSDSVEILSISSDGTS